MVSLAGSKFLFIALSFIPRRVAEGAKNRHTVFFRVVNSRQSARVCRGDFSDRLRSSAGVETTSLKPDIHALPLCGSARNNVQCDKWEFLL